MSNQSIKPSNRSRVGLQFGAGAPENATFTAEARTDGVPDIAKAAEIPGSPSRAGIRSCVRDTAYFASSTPIALSSSPTSSAYSSSSVSDNDSDALSPPSYQSIFPPSPPSSAASSPSDSILSKFASRQVLVAQANQNNGAVPLSTPPTDSDAPISPPTLLETVFPCSSSIHSFPAFPVDLSSTIGQGWKGVVVDNLIAGTRTLYVGGGKFDDVELRDTVCEVLDQAEEEYGATGVVLCLEKGNNKEQLGLLVHQLMYIGCTVLKQDGLEPNPAYLLLGMDL
ncbi:uncharacterized protein JCM6883_000873 [Sporobolomyces salmoneus]|uniref:uncharacterized protein n=1 Tax=Sporobolomyces salmoneus TaxID=183962 RepID=UPI003171D7C9